MAVGRSGTAVQDPPESSPSTGALPTRARRAPQTQPRGITGRIRRARRRRLRSAVVAATGLSLVAASVVAIVALDDDDSDRTSLVAGSRPGSDAGYTTAVAFRTAADGPVTGANVYLPRVTSRAESATVTLWDSKGTALSSARVQLPAERNAWTDVAFPKPATVRGNTTYVLGYWAGTSNGRAPRFGAKPVQGVTIVNGLAGRGTEFPTRVFRTERQRVQPLWTSGTPAPSPTATLPSPPATSVPPAKPPATTPPGSGGGGAGNPSTPPEPQAPSGAFPGAGNTGVPKGTALTAYSGPMTITKSGTVIDGKTIKGRLVISAKDVTVKRSKVDGVIDSDNGGAVTVEDSEVNGGSGTAAAIGYHNVTVLRSNVYGGQHSINCGNNCLVQDSWLHDQALPAGTDYHNNAYISNGGTNVTLKHNTLHCTPRDNSSGGGCSTNASFFGDFAPIKNVTVSGNLFKATPGGFCATFGFNGAKAFGNSSANVSVTNNVFERGSGGKCGYWGPVTGFSPAGGTWSGNVWADGGTISPAK